MQGFGLACRQAGSQRVRRMLAVFAGCRGTSNYWPDLCPPPDQRYTVCAGVRTQMSIGGMTGVFRDRPTAGVQIRPDEHPQRDTARRHGVRCGLTNVATTSPTKYVSDHTRSASALGAPLPHPRVPDPSSRSWPDGRLGAILAARLVVVSVPGPPPRARRRARSQGILEPELDTVGDPAWVRFLSRA